MESFKRNPKVDNYVFWCECCQLESPVYEKRKAQFLYGVHVLSKAHKELKEAFPNGRPDADKRMPNISTLIKKPR